MEETSTRMNRDHATNRAFVSASYCIPFAVEFTGGMSVGARALMQKIALASYVHFRLDPNRRELDHRRERWKLRFGEGRHCVCLRG